MLRALNPELKRAINQQAHFLAAQSFAAIRADLEQLARGYLKDGKGLDETIRAINMAGLGLPTGPRIK